MKKHKVLVPILFVLLFFTVFLGCSAYWKVGWWHSSAADGDSDSTTTDTEVIDVNKVISIGNSGKNETLMAVNTTFYNYLYDKEIYDNVRDQGAQGCFDTIYENGKVKQLNAIPYGAFDSKLSDYYKENNVKSGIYTGNFYNYYGGLPGVGDKKIPFPGYYYFPWAANIANRTPNYDSVCQGIVCEDLDGFTSGDEKSGTLMTSTSTDGKVAVPYFDSDFLATKVAVTKAGQTTQVPIGVVQKNVYFPFRKIKTGSKAGYYEFDSTKDVVRFKGMQTSTPPNADYYFGSEAKLEYEYYEGDNSNKVYSMASDNPQFLPFNKGNYDTMKEADQTHYEKKLDCQKKIDYGFGIRYNIPFYLSEDGKVNGKNMVFEFSGDDDVWVFLDGKLVMDLGGQHGKAEGTINFGGKNTEATVTIAKVTYVKDKDGKVVSDAKMTATSDKILKEDTSIASDVTTTIDGIEKGDTHKHIITVFYLERGMFESNFHMAFNFVPANVSKPEATPEPVINPNKIENGSLTVQNKMVFPTTTPDTNGNSVDKINATFLPTVKDLAEDDVFQYFIQNKGTDKANVIYNDITYPSGMLTVRENGSDKLGKKKSYLSFGAKPNIRIYIDMGAIKTTLRGWNPSYDPYINFPQFDYQYDNKNIYNLAEKPKKILYKHNEEGIYYFDIKKTDTFYFEIEVELSNQKIRLRYVKDQDPYDQLNPITDASGHDGHLLKFLDPLYINKTVYFTSYQWTNPNDTTKYPPLGGGNADYSSGLPYQSAGTKDTNKFRPSNTSEFQAVSDTAYKITEAHLAATDGTTIKENSQITSGITGNTANNNAGLFNLFYDDSATFLKQFATGSRMKVVQEDSLMKPNRYTGELSETVPENAEDALTTFVAPAKARKTSDYYYTTVKAESRQLDTDNKVVSSAAIDVTYDGQFNFSNAPGITGAVDITQTFTNTIKTGSLTISKELKGNMKDNDNYSYGFKVTFSNVFGGGSSGSVYKGECSYTLVEEDGIETTKKVDDEIIELKPNEKAIISGIPVGTEYTIEEVNVSDGSVVSKIQTSYVAEVEGEKITSPTYTETSTEADIKVDKENRTISGVIPCSVVNKSYGTATNEFSEVNVFVAYTNQFGALTITKNIAGDTKNVSYYYNNTTKEKTYTFTVTNGDTPYKGPYKVYTYDYSAGTNKPPKVTTNTETTSDGEITLLNGQMAEIGEIPLAGVNIKYTITEIIKATDIYFVESLNVTSGTGQSKTTGSGSITEIDTHNTEITTGVFSSSQPTFDVIYTNRYSNAYIEIDKFIDKLYYGDKKYADYADANKTDITYQDLTNAKQSFIFKVKQYKTLDNAKEDEECEGSFNVVLDMKDKNTVQLTGNAIEKFDGVDYTYKNSKEIKVLANRYYRIEEDTNWSWKYTLKGVKAEDSKPDPESSTKDNKVVILKTYLDALNSIDGKVVPIAKFYNALDTDKEDIEGDTDSIPNIIKKK